MRSAGQRLPFGIALAVIHRAHGHARLAGAQGTGRHVLEHHAPFGFDAQPPGRQEVHVGILLAADGIVSKIADVVPPKEMEMGDEPMTRVSIFMSVFSVHVNRAPMAGKIVKMHYRPGAFVDVSLDKESENNERQELALETKDGKKIIFVQIAGLVARRILTFVKEGDSVKAGERFGLIRFGSRLDVYLPKGTAIRVTEGQTAVAGETVLADINVTGDSAQGEIF